MTFSSTVIKHRKINDIFVRVSKLILLNIHTGITAMESKDIIIFAAVFAVLGFSLYRKYIKKNQAGPTGQKGKTPGSSFSSVKDDDYEPYSKK